MQKNDTLQFFRECGVEPSSSSSCPQSLLIPDVAEDGSCASYEDYRVVRSQATCANRKLVMEDLRQDSSDDLALMYDFFCMPESERYCEVYLESLGVIDTAAIMGDFFSCSSDSPCSQRCRSALEDTKGLLGCCWSYLNASLVSVGAASGSPVPFSSRLVWDQCGVEVPDACSEEAGSVTDPTSTSTTTKPDSTTTGPGTFSGGSGTSDFLSALKVLGELWVSTKDAIVCMDFIYVEIVKQYYC